MRHLLYFNFIKFLLSVQTFLQSETLKIQLYEYNLPHTTNLSIWV